MNSERTIRSHAIDVPSWIDQGITDHDVRSICEGGCASGAYMPAVMYVEAARTMAEHGDDVIEYIDDTLGDIPKPEIVASWSSLAVFYLSTAVDLWASMVLEELDES